MFIELVNIPFLKLGGTGEQFRTAVALATERGRLEMHEGATYMRLWIARSSAEHKDGRNQFCLPAYNLD